MTLNLTSSVFFTLCSLRIAGPFILIIDSLWHTVQSLRKLRGMGKVIFESSTSSRGWAFCSSLSLFRHWLHKRCLEPTGEGDDGREGKYSLCLS